MIQAWFAAVEQELVKRAIAQQQQVGRPLTLDEQSALTEQYLRDQLAQSEAGTLNAVVVPIAQTVPLPGRPRAYDPPAPRRSTRRQPGPCRKTPIPRGDRCRRCGFPLAAHTAPPRRYYDAD